jgi:hypothetical protein
MNYLKNVLILTLCITKLSLAQKPSIGIKFGLAFSNSTIEFSNPNFYPPPASSRTGLLGGIYVDIPGGKNFILRPGAEVVPKGGKENGYPVLFTFADFPVSILYKIKLPNGHLLAGGGPSIGLPINDYYGNYPLKIELGINGMAGYEIPLGFSVNINYSYGLNNASRNKDVTKKISNRYLGITLGYSF